MLGEGVVSEHVAQRSFQCFNTGEENTKDLTRFRRSKLWHIENISRVLEENQQKSTRRLSEELCALKDIIPRQIKTFGKSYRSSRSVPHDFTSHQAQRRMDICRQLIGNLTDGRFIRRSVACDENGSITATLTSRNSCSALVNLPKSSLKNRFSPKVMLWVCWNF